MLGASIIKYPNQHEARLAVLSDFDNVGFREVEIQDGITALIATKKLDTENKFSIYCYRFDALKHTAKEAQDWLNRFNIQFSEFEQSEEGPQKVGETESVPDINPAPTGISVMDRISELNIKFKSAANSFISKPFPNEHAARVRDPNDFIRLRSKEIADGIRIIGGPLKNDPQGGFVAQSYRFNRASFSPEEAEDWLKSHNISATLEEATEKGMKKELILRLRMISDNLAKAIELLEASNKRKPKEPELDANIEEEEDVYQKQNEPNSPVDYSSFKLKRIDYNDGTVGAELEISKGNDNILFINCDSISTGKQSVDLDQFSKIILDEPVWYISLGDKDKAEVKEEIVIDSGECDLGIVKSDNNFVELFLYGDKLRGRYLFTVKKGSLRFVEPRSKLPYILSPSAVRDVTTIEKLDGRSGLPRLLEDEIAEDKKYWLDDSNEIAHTRRHSLVEEWEYEGFIHKIADGKFSIIPPNISKKNFEIYMPFKKFDFEKRLLYGIVYEPDVVDAQGDSASAAEIERAAHSFAKNGWMVGKMHKQKAEGVSVVENYIAPCDFRYDGSSDIVKKGSWILVTHVGNDEIAKEIKAGKLTGYSMAGMAASENQ